MYIDNYAGNLKGVEEKLDYLEECQVNYIHLMPFWIRRKDARTVGMPYRIFARYSRSLARWKILKA